MTGWHRNLTDSTREVTDIIAKALMIRAGGSVAMTDEELTEAAYTQAEYRLAPDGTLEFRVERQ